MEKMNDTLNNLPKLTPKDFEFVQSGEAIKDEKFKTESIGFAKDAWLRFVRNRMSFTAFIILAILVLFAIIGPSLQPYTYTEQSLNEQLLPPKFPFIEKLGIMDGSKTIVVGRDRVKNYEKRDSFMKEVSSEVVKVAGKPEVEMVTIKVDLYKDKKLPANKYHLFGTDNLGRDLWVRLWRGARVSLILAAVVVFINTTLGLIIGSLMGYFGGAVDFIGYRLMEIISGVPTLILLMIIVSTFGQSIGVIILAFIISGWIGTASQIRAQFYKYKNYEYVLASRTMGAKDRSLIFKHILPNAVGPVITGVSLSIPSVVLSESNLSYLGLGIQPPEPAVGNLLKEGQGTLLNFPHMLLFPALFISILMLCFNLMGNGLRDAFDPTLRGQ